MALVAKVYQEYKQKGGAFTDSDGKNYVNVETEEGLKPVRVYTIEQYNFLLGMQFKKDQLEQEKGRIARSYNQERKENAGFKNGYIVAILGDTFEGKDKLKVQGAKFSTGFKWYFEGGTEENYKGQFETRKIYWEEASEEIDNGCIRLKSINELEKLVKVEFDIKEGSNFVKERDSQVRGLFHVGRIRIIDGPRGRYAMNILEDSKDNVYIWNTSIADMPKKGIYYLKAAVSSHNVYEGVRQTILKDVEII